MRKKLFVCSFLLAFAMTVSASAGIIFSIGIAPPPLPIYEQPVCPGDGYIWTPGYWAYDDGGGYFWVPGTWVLVPEPGVLWTPGWWGWDGAFFVFHEGYWGPLVGFYGGIDYGFGYGGIGYDGGYWRNGAFFYNRSVNNVVNVTNVYNKTVIVNTTVRNVSYNGGEGGTTARPTPAEEGAARERHVPPVPTQREHVQQASTNRQLFESMNHGRPPVAATVRPAEFSGRGVVQARSAGPAYRPVTERSTMTRSVGPNRGVTPGTGTNVIHPRELPPVERQAPYSGNAKADRKYQQEQEKLAAKQEQERQGLQRKQDQEHQRLEQHRASQAEMQRVEQRHQQETQQLVQKHAQEQLRIQAKPKSER